MLRIDLTTTGLDRTLHSLHLFEEKQLRWMVADAMTASAHAAHRQLKADTPRYVDRPTPYTLNAVTVFPGRVRERDLSVIVGFRRAFPAPGADSQLEGYHYLLPMARGGERHKKASEKKLGRVGLYGKYVIPVFYDQAGAGFKADAYGNLSGGKYIQVLSRLKAFTYEEAVGNASRARRSTAKRSISDYFIARMKTAEGEKLAVYIRAGAKPSGKGGKGSAKGGRPRTVGLKRGYHTAFYVLDQAPRYRATFPVSGILREVFSAAYPQALRAKWQSEMARYGFSS